MHFCFLFRASREIDYRRIVHYPEDGKYTIKKLKMTKLGGRHPVTGRKVSVYQIMGLVKYQ